MTTSEFHQADNPANQGAYRDFLSTREEILKFKWIASEQAGQDVGFESALLGWHARQRKEKSEGGDKAVRKAGNAAATGKP
jgi:hypothetical protein